MRDAVVGRVLVASLHQGISDILPTRLAFYESWLHAEGLRDGTIGLAPLYAVLSFLRQEGEDPYARITTCAGEYAADWTVDGLSRPRRAITRALPRRLRTRLALRIARELVHGTYGGSRGVVSMRQGGATIDSRSSIFCGVREPSPAPLCGFYKAAFARLLARFDLPAVLEITSCRGTGSGGCFVAITLMPAASSTREPAMRPDPASEPSA